MGAENSVLEGCEWGEEVLAAGLDWDLQHAELQDSRPITVFQPCKNERKYKDMIQQLAKSLKMLRHPSILRYIGAGKSSDGHFLVTEQATPLAVVLDKLSPLELCSGLGDILEAVTFLHEKAGVTHNNVSVSAIFVSKDGSWKLGELQHACPFHDATADYLDACRAFRDQDALPPEEKQGQVDAKKDQGHARDMFAVGVLCEQLTEQLSELGDFKESFEQKIAACLSADPTHRPRALELKNDCLFQNDFIQILNFVRNVALKTVEEKADFFGGLLPRLSALPEELVARRLAIPLLSRFVVLEEAAVNHVLPHLLTPRMGEDSDHVIPSPRGLVTPLLDADLFRNYVIPELQRIFLVHDVHIRLVLLEHFSAFAPLFDRETLQGDVFPQILLGLRDSHDSIVASSLRALADLVPLLGGDVVIGGQRKTFFFQGMPKFLPTRGQQEKGPSSAGEVLWPDNNTSLLANGKPGNKSLPASGKPLLKDLIAGGTPSPSREADQEQRRQDRERRREEARKKKEERQRKFRLLQAELEMEKRNAPGSDTDKGSPDDSTDTVSATDSTHRANTDDAHNADGSGSKPDDSLDDIDEESTDEAEKDKEGDARVEDEKFASEDSGEDWEDWDNKDGNSAWENKDRNSVGKSQDDIIGDEIEAELSQMSPGKKNSPREAERKKVPTSPNPYTPSSPPTDIDWSDSHFDSVITGAKPPPAEDSPPKGIPHTDSVSSDPKQTSGKGLKLLAKNKSASAARTAGPVKKAAVSDDLGLGYDIKSIELSVVARQEEDFFADMAPEIKPSADRSLLGSVTTVESTGLTDQTTVGVGRFAVADSVAEESAGWGDEDDWGGDF
ncbi:protein-associating with the carboxyl-terminal domain of ezrin-like [Babylonia areolata]|uniref:protein-associating with the carboxyl-terminal domain of ezrin-like n=1 Tax=Babylonia areolata TaxID=304850 RepID=UPI003FD36547